MTPAREDLRDATRMGYQADVGYCGSSCCCSRIAKQTMNIDVTLIDFNLPGALEAAITPKTRVSCARVFRCTAPS